MYRDNSGVLAKAMGWFRLTGKEKKDKSRSDVIRENVQWIVISVIIALGIRYFIVEAFKIPTGSMAPTLVGVHKHVVCPNCGWDFTRDHRGSSATCPNCWFQISVYKDSSHGGNRIFVNKFIYDFSKPERWNVMVFKYPLADIRCKDCGYVMIDTRWTEGMTCERCGSTRLKWKRKNYIKRLVGLPGERLQIKNGDLFINDRVAQKPRITQDGLWVPVYDSEYPPKKEVVPSWNFEEPYWGKGADGLFLDVSGSAVKASYATFARKIVDNYAYNNMAGANVVGDLRLKLGVSVRKGSGGVFLAIVRGEDVFQAFLPTVDAGEKCRLELSGRTLVEADVSMELGRRYEVELCHADGAVWLLLDGKQVLSYDYGTDAPDYGGQLSNSGTMIGGRGVACRFDDIEIYRDIYYSSDLTSGQWGVSEPIKIGEGQYFVLGDNSINSKDSRVWKFVYEEDIVGKAFLVFWPLSGIRMIR